MWRGGKGRYFFNKSKSHNQNQGRSFKKYTPCPKRALNNSNQYFMDEFLALYKKVNKSGGYSNMSSCYKRVCLALSKYPFPIVKSAQCKHLEGVGDKMQDMFHKFIKRRESKYLEKQREHPDFDEDNHLTLAQKIVAEDHQIRAQETGLNNLFKRKKVGELDGEGIGNIDRNNLNAGTKRRKKLEGFLDIGSSTWSMFLACYFISFYKGADQEAIKFDKHSIQNMLNHISRQVGKNIPIDKKFDKDEFDRVLKSELIIKDNDDNYSITAKGIKRAIRICKDAGILVEVRKAHGPNNPEKTNEVSVSLFDRNMLPQMEKFSSGTQVKGDDFSIEQENKIFSGIVNDLEDTIQNTKDNIHDKDDNDTTEIAHSSNHEENGLLNFKEGLDTVKEEEDEEEEKHVQLEFKDEPRDDKPHNFKLVLIIDNREVRTREDRDYLYNKLSDCNIYCERRSLPLGDFIWLLRVPRKYKKLSKKEEKRRAKLKKKKQTAEEVIKEEEIENSDKENDDKKDFMDMYNEEDLLDPNEIDFTNPDHYYEYVLDLIIERKTSNDLAASIRDGRYDEQKYRLRNCGINNVVYLIEGKLKGKQNIPESTLDTACLHTRLYSEFSIIKTDSEKDTLRWFVEVHNFIEQSMKKWSAYKCQTSFMEYSSFAKDSAKSGNKTLENVFAQQLRGIKGLGPENLSIIVKVFRTPSLLFGCYDRCRTDAQALNLLNSAKLEYFTKRLNQENESEIELAQVISNAKPKKFSEKLKGSLAKDVFKKVNKKISEMLYKIYYCNNYSK
ncbi:unnamed protein product [Moneuplotes crassus]|uniref:Crossover junction endonuclease MUS81 n=1 Tax=Euplotes crassus TaxID=5936 RepID=A0AAD1Y7Y9_EUPCR|nr:unnamed protein product [Moneuplotes crassus]